jgi:hypothetical protein
MVHIHMPIKTKNTVAATIFLSAGREAVTGLLGFDVLVTVGSESGSGDKVVTILT